MGIETNTNAPSPQIEQEYNESKECQNLLESIHSSKGQQEDCNLDQDQDQEHVNFETDSNVNKRYNILSFLTQKIDRFENWSDEDIPVGPNKAVLRIVKEMLPEFIENNLIPFRITPSSDEGLCLVFASENKIVYLEYYNDEDIGLISEDFFKKKVLDNIDLGKKDIVQTLKGILTDIHGISL
jgi:hypothetical protein